MSLYEFSLNNNTFKLEESNCFDFFNEDVNGVNLTNILDILSENTPTLEFQKEYYSSPCDNCKNGKGEEKVFDFLEGHFFIFTKNNEYIMSDISKEYENTSFRRLLAEGKVDDSYIVEISICPYCKNYSIEIDQCPI
ncbi:DUF3785 family protein [Clostridium fallax]|uniref:DUF3785 domain-containing protein n=1 Tax=Clostridium fallax TaxID=1533 RepID=A0A1M4Z187_9CLOT|nr:DUF3785 family protein [Clostridium fallax]SHF11750.1 Protein of unknown function [Clostridium fallax]SQB22206.1 Protein of uncharacterised function (DUF3785) [Clostridium fallax]